MMATGAMRTSQQVDGLRIAPSHPSLEGHFPGNHVVPGVVLLDEVLGIIRGTQPQLELSGIPSVKFLSPLLPDEIFSIRIEQDHMNFRFECFAGQRALAKGCLRMAGASGQDA